MNANDILKLLGGVATTTLVPAIILFLQKHFTATQLTTTMKIVDKAVAAVEQLAGTQQWTNEEKYNKAAAYASQLAAKAGIKVDPDHLKPLIEGSVGELNQAKTQLVVPGGVTIPPEGQLNSGVVARFIEQSLARELEPRTPASGQTGGPSSTTPG